MENGKENFKLKILIVDDESGMRDGAARCLKSLSFKETDFPEKISFEIFLAETGEAALKEIKEKSPDIVLLDYKLPDMNGLEVLQNCDSTRFLTIVITAFASLEVAITATRRGAFDFLAKPFSPDELREAVKKAVKNIFMSRKVRQLQEEKSRIRFEFVSILAHELKSPLAAIEGYLRLIDERVKGEQLASYDAMVKRSMERIISMRKLINDILDLTRLESGKKKRIIEELDLGEISLYVYEGLALKAAEKKLKFELNYPEKFKFAADKEEMEMLFSNLLSNAVKYNKQGGEIKLTIEKKDEFVSISCSDTGIGISKEEQQRLFGEFVRIKNEYTRNIEGSGLGLSIIKKIAAIYNGEVKVESTYNVGSVFSVKLKELYLSAKSAAPVNRLEVL